METVINEGQQVSQTSISILRDVPYHLKMPDKSSLPAFYVDTNLDQVIHTITKKCQEYNLDPFYFSTLDNVNSILYRQEVFLDLDGTETFSFVKAFSEKMIIMRRYLGLVAKLDFPRHKEGWYLEAILQYCEAVSDLANQLEQVELKSRGFNAFRQYLLGYVRSAEYQAFETEAKRIKAALSEVKYCIMIKGNWVRVRKYDGGIDYSTEIEHVFEKFKQGAVKSYLSDLVIASGMNHVGAQILEFVARLYPDVFKSLRAFCVQNNNFLDETIQLFDQEIQFYISYLEYIGTLKTAGQPFCYPQIAVENKEIQVLDGYDLALANKCVKDNSVIVYNDFYLKGDERVIIVSGPNQGGKTTFARMFGQLHYFASLGCPVPARSARLFLFDQIYTHFEQEENIKNLRGKLQDDLMRIHKILEEATPDSLIILNEIFTSTTLKDAIFLSKKVIEKICELDCLCVWVTFIDELSRFNTKTISMVSTVDLENPAHRTFKIVRKPADGLSYANSIAEKYHLTQNQIMKRIQK